MQSTKKRAKRNCFGHDSSDERWHQMLWFRYEWKDNIKASIFHQTALNLHQYRASYTQITTFHCLHQPKLWEIECFFFTINALFFPCVMFDKVILLARCRNVKYSLFLIIWTDPDRNLWCSKWSACILRSGACVMLDVADIRKCSRLEERLWF
jgi:uncharacterized membrane protein YcfT